MCKRKYVGKPIKGRFNSKRAKADLCKNSLWNCKEELQIKICKRRICNRKFAKGEFATKNLQKEICKREIVLKTINKTRLKIG